MQAYHDYECGVRARGREGARLCPRARTSASWFWPAAPTTSTRRSATASTSWPRRWASSWSARTASVQLGRAGRRCACSTSGRIIRGSIARRSTPRTQQDTELVQLVSLRLRRGRDHHRRGARHSRKRTASSTRRSKSTRSPTWARSKIRLRSLLGALEERGEEHADELHITSPLRRK